MAPLNPFPPVHPDAWSAHQQVLADYSGTVGDLITQFASFTGRAVNQVPFPGSWTAGQVAEHLEKSNIMITRALVLPGQPAHRDPAARIAELRESFLDLRVKFKSPDFILPIRGTYDHETMARQLRLSAEALLEAAREVRPDELIQVPAFGEISRLEILHFVLYHTRRHLHQLRNILAHLPPGEPGGKTDSNSPDA
ncbi:MAG TPA: DinB family protein [Chitinophagaceae bacterium]|nr:DinB family protein [Chitinophagaceae bacterium]